MEVSNGPTSRAWHKAMSDTILQVWRGGGNSELAWGSEWHRGEPSGRGRTAPDQVGNGLCKALTKAKLKEPSLEQGSSEGGRTR